MPHACLAQPPTPNALREVVTICIMETILAFCGALEHQTMLNITMRYGSPGPDTDIVNQLVCDKAELNTN